jgi:hypothetical protein
MSDYLVEQVVWVAPSARIKEMDGKNIVIIDRGSKIPAWVTVDHAHLESPHAGLCCVSVNQSSVIQTHPGDDDLKLPPTRRIHPWRRYLNLLALGLVCPRNASELPRADLELRLPSSAESETRPQSGSDTET